MSTDATPDRPDPTVALATPADADGITELVHRCYGDTYPNPTLYRPAELARRIRNRLFVAGVARSATGAIVAHMSATGIDKPDRLPVLGTTLVDPDLRGRGIAWNVGEHLIEHLRRRGIAGFLHYPTTAHSIMQQRSVVTGHEVGLMLDHLPAATSYTGIDDSPRTDRVATTVVVEVLSPFPVRGIHLPGDLVTLVTSLANAAGIGRSIVADVATNAASPPRLADESATIGVNHLRSDPAGRPLHEWLDHLVDDGHVTYVDLPCRPGVGRHARDLSDAGFVFSSWVPSAADVDVIRLQRPARPISAASLAAVDLVNPTARRLADFIADGFDAAGT